MKRFGFKNEQIEVILKYLVEKPDQFPPRIQAMLSEEQKQFKRKRHRKRRWYHDERTAQEALERVARKVKAQKRQERIQKQAAQSEAFKRKVRRSGSLDRIYRMFDEGVSRTTISRRFGVPRWVITYLWDHRNDEDQD